MPTAPSQSTASQEVVSKLARLAVTRSAENDMAEVVAGNNAFSLDLLRAVRSKNKNLVCSPYSLSLALAMTMAGAKGKTQDEMKQVLHVSLSDDRLQPALNALDRSLTSNGSFKCANSVWGQAGRTFKQPFVDLVAQYYGASLRLLDMDGNYAEACKTINAWVSDKTNGRITGLMNPEDKPDMRLLAMLVNAVHFKARWLDPFWRTGTEPQPFFLLKGGTADVPMVRRIGKYAFLKTEKLEAVELPYEGKQFSMVILMPGKGGFEDFIEQADQQEIGETLSDLRSGKLNLRVPSFEITSTPDVEQALKAMGMPTAFTASADFTGIADPVPGWPPWCISGVRQKAFIKVDEQGTEAAAASAVTMAAAGTTTTTTPPLEMTIDRPFVYLIRDMRSDAILFIGQVVDPRDGNAP
jgi:serpin B